MSKSTNVWSKYADTPTYIVKRESVRSRDKRASQKRNVRIHVDAILKDSTDVEGGDDNE